MNYRPVVCCLAWLICACGNARAEPATIVDAAERNQLQIVQQLIQENADVNTVQVDGMSALHWAVYNDNVPLAKLLIRNKADVNAKNRYGIAPLSLACTNGNGILAEDLLEAGADANTTIGGGETALMIAARTGKLRPVELLIKHGADVNEKQRKKQTALMFAAAEGHADVVAELLEAGAEFNAKLDSGFTPFFFAVRSGHTDVAFMLLDAGVDINAVMDPKRSGGKAPRNGMSALILAIENGHFELAVALMEADAKINDLRSGFGPLHVITWVRKPNFGDNPEGDPSPIGSGQLTSLDLVRKLVEYGADVNLKLRRGKSGRGRLSREGSTAFLMAADTADVPLMKLLLELGADPTIPNEDNCMPLLAAAGIGSLAPEEEAGDETESLEAVKLLLSLGADINHVDNNGETAMHGAAYKNLPKMVHFLAENGADINRWNNRNKYGWTPLLIAQGYRPGNFKPAASTISAIKEVMLTSDVELPEDPGIRKGNNDEWAKPKDAKKK